MTAGSTGRPSTTGRDLSSELVRYADQLRAAAESLGPDRAHDRPSDEDWCAAEIVAHAVEIQGYWLGQGRKVVESPGSRFGRTKEDPDRVGWVATHGGRVLADLIEDLDRETTETAEGLRGFSDEELDVVGVHHRRGEMTVREILQVWVVDHMAEHLGQIRDLTRDLAAVDGHPHATQEAREDG